MKPRQLVLHPLLKIWALSINLLINLPLNAKRQNYFDEQPEDTESQHPTSTGDSVEGENYEDDIVTNSVSASDKSDTEGNVDGNIDDLNYKVWI